LANVWEERGEAEKTGQHAYVQKWRKMVLLQQ